MKDESSDARKSTTRAISSVDPSRPCGLLAAREARTAAAASAEYPFSMIPESVGPGLMALTRTPCSASSDAAVRANDRRAAFDAAYALVPGIPRRALIEALRTTAP